MKALYGLLTILLVTAIIMSIFYISKNTEFMKQVFGYFIVIISINGIVISYKKLYKKSKKQQ